MRVVVIGSGVVGSTAALHLAERGLKVTLLERHAHPAEETSHANGGGMTPGHAEPWNAPGIHRRVLSHSGNRKPFRIFAHALPGLAGWGQRFLLHSSAERYYRNARTSTRLAVYSGECLQALRARHTLAYHAYLDGSLELYFDPRELDHALALRRRIGDPGVTIRSLAVDEAVALEPALGPVAGHIAGVLLMPRHESGDAREFSAEMVRCARALGADVRFGCTARAILTEAGSVSGVAVDDAVVAADAVVLAAGCASPALARPLGLRLPMVPVKGYSATLELAATDRAPVVPLLDLERRIVTARFGQRLRLAGLADFDGYNRTIRPQRLEHLLASARALLPELADRIQRANVRPWAGLRPMTPTGPPLLGPTALGGLYLNTGHGSMGWTQAAGSAAVIADLITGQTPAIDLAGLLPGDHGVG